MVKSLRTVLKETRPSVKRDSLQDLLRNRIGANPEAIEAKILAVRDVERVNWWLDFFAVADKLNDIRFSGLEEVIEDTMRDSQAYETARDIARTIREMTLEQGREGRLQTRRDTLLLCLKAKFERGGRKARGDNSGNRGQRANRRLASRGRSIDQTVRGLV